MKKYIFALILIVVTCQCPSLAFSHNPFTAERKTCQQAPTAPFESRFFAKLILWQHQLKQKISELIQESRTTGSIKPLMLLMVSAFAYGVIHAAGPGHGKAVGMSFILSRNASIGSGLMFGTLIAFFHGFSGIICVLGLRYVLQKGVFGTLGTISETTQIVSFSLIALLGLFILLKNGYGFFPKHEFKPNFSDKNSKASKKGLFIWALTVGLVPCPSVVMVLLFCLSMDMMAVGIYSAAFISLGMAATISFVTISTVIGKGICLIHFSAKHTGFVERIMGVVSGLAITILGVLFLATTIR